MTGRQDLFDESMNLGHSAAWEMDWDKALEYYRKALAEFPDHSTALTSLGLALLETGNRNEALEIYRKACAASPEDPIPVEKCAEIHELQGDIQQAVNQRETAADLYIRRRNTEKAIENWSCIARLTPDNLAVRSRLALTYERLGRRREASYEYLTVASILQKKNKQDRAIEAAQLALRLTPGDPEASNAVRSLRHQKILPPPGPPRGHTGPLRIAEMEEYLKASPEEDPDESSDELDDPEVAAQRQALTILAGMLFDESTTDFDEDEDHAEGQGPLSMLRRETEQKDRYKYLSQAIDLQTRGNKRQASKELVNAIGEGLDHPAAYYNLGILLKDLHDFEGARKNITAAIGHPELTLGANLALGRLARQAGDLTEAARHLLQALRIADTLTVSSDQSSQLNRFYDTIMVSQTKDDDQNLSQIVENTLAFLSGPHWLHRIKLARKKLESQGSSSTVIPIAEILAVGGTDRVVEAIERIDTLASQHKYYSAIEEAMLALDYAPLYLGLHLRLAEILIDSDHREQGLSKLAMIAKTHAVRGETVQAAKIYHRLIKASPVDLVARKELINLLAQQDQIDDALSQYYDLADLFRQMAESERSRQTLTDALKLAQRSKNEVDWSVKILHQIGDLDISRLDWQRALRVYEQILTLSDDDEIARLKMIDLGLRLGKEEVIVAHLDKHLQLLVQTRRGKEALALLEDLAREHPGRQILHARLADAYRAIGRKSDAIAQYDALGEIQLDAGHRKEAIKTIRTIIEIGPPDINVDGYHDLLNNLEKGV
ncbi:MAG: tetratricopeptide repeat protein [Anaerolineales bacterium]|nr:tetratricopeptide repeat protein [Anaerolineales bacterium]